jgi:cytochrome b6-f complex iron-sulfur subunit
MCRDHALKSRAPRAGRRELLSWGLVAASTALTANLLDVGLRFAHPNAAAGEFGGKFDLGSLADLPDADAPPANHPEGRFFLVRTDAGVTALHKVCTHLSCLLAWDDQAGAFVCPCHGSQFGRDGQVTTGPAARNLDQFVVRLVTPDGQVIAETDSRRGGPVAIPGAMSPQKTPDSDASPTPAGQANDAETADGGEDAPTVPGVRVIVDTGRLIPGRGNSARS